MKIIDSQKELSQEDNARLVIDFIHRLAIHHAMWFFEIKQQFGQEKAFDILSNAFTKSSAIQMRRLGKSLGFEMDGDIPVPLLNLSKDSLVSLKEDIALNWLANDGVWFQSVEFTEGMDRAKSCNDACWSRFSPFEAWSTRRFLDLPENPGLDGLKQALQFRLYATINKQSFIEETPESFILTMNDCRVQSTRKRKGLADYPCKSAGIVEYSTFAESIDKRIKTMCVGCPPDDHPDEWYCAWKFSL